MFFFYAVGLIFFGPLSERFGLKETICFGLLILSMLMIISFFITNFTNFLIIRGLQGFWAASFAPVSFIYVLNVLEKKHHGITVGVINTGFLSAGVLGQLLSSSVNLFFHWQAIFLTLAISYIALLIYAIKKLPKPQIKQEKRSLIQLIRLLAKLPLQKDLKKLYFITFTTLLAFVAYYTSLENFFQHTLSLSEQAIFAIRAFGLIGLIVTVFSVKIGHRIGFENTIIAGLLLSLLGLILSMITNIFIIAFGTIAFVAGIAIIIPSLIHLLGVKGGENRSLTISMYSFILLLGASLGSGISIVSNYFSQIVTLLFLLVGSLIVTLLEKRQLSKR
ncbi:MFS transporter [Anaerobacillus sp. CMMVII]|uniref:MFS transporter n=1 Tax=Anaerobacillus sp. CMMVII TaxID=2755588 RepID=UPI0021C4E3A6|nr:MFS transporter [Anaerobacillus sp. CMMVII]MCT8136550.1 MFS transporter [Anaerobacillus sp. CMMVII]